MQELPESLPVYLADTYKMLKCAFPNGISEEYLPIVMAFLTEHMSIRNAAAVIASLRPAVQYHRGDYMIYYNMVAHNMWTRSLTEKERNELIVKLSPFGYENWLKSP